MSWSGRCGFSTTLTRLEVTTRDSVLAVTLAPADGWDSSARQPGVWQATCRDVEHQRREAESRAIAAELDAKSADMRLYLAGLPGAAPQELPKEWLGYYEVSSSEAVETDGAAVVRAAPAETLWLPEEWVVQYESLNSGPAVQIPGPAVVTAAPAATQKPPEEWVAHWKSLSGAAAAQRGRTAVVAAAPEPMCTVCATAKQVQLDRSGSDGMAGTAAGLHLEVRAQEVLFELPPGVSMRPGEPGEPQDSESVSAMKYLAAWIRASGARSVWLKPWHEGTQAAAAAELAPAIELMFWGEEQDDISHRLVLGTADEERPWLAQLSTRHGLNCIHGTDPNGAICGLIFEPMP